MIPIDNVLIDAPDCCGKTTLYAGLHKATGFKYNVQDRSNLSMLCYARLYGREETHHLDALCREVACANNFYVVPLMPLPVVLDRLYRRGDECQDEASLTRLHELFESVVGVLERLPNVHVVRKVMSKEETASEVKDAIGRYSDMSGADLGDLLSLWVPKEGLRETQFRARLDVSPDHVDDEIMSDSHEGEYYDTILKALRSIVSDEIAGRNPYGKPQGRDSRRFFYADRSCISSIHFLPRAEATKVIVGLRSTDAVRNGRKDLRFLQHLAATIPREFGWKPEKIELDVTFDSLHVID